MFVFTVLAAKAANSKGDVFKRLTEHLGLYRRP